MTVETPQKAPPGGIPDRDRRGPRSPTVKEPAPISFPAIPAVEQPAQARGTAELPVTTAVATDVYARRALATPRSRHSVRNRIIGFGIVGGLTVAGAFGLRAAMSQPGGSPDISPTHPPATDTFKAPANTPRVEITPDHFPLNPKTLKNSGINIESYSTPLSETNPYANVIVLYAPTIENVQKNPDGTTLLTVAFPGGPLTAYDQGRADKNLDGSSTEVVYYGWDVLTNKYLPNTVVKILVNKSPMVQTDTGVSQQGIDFRVGSADWDFVASRSNNPDLLTSLQKTAGTTVGLPTINIQVLRPQSS